jgi:dTDP-4-dehydrorhamnose 3,5-epimerase
MPIHKTAFPGLMLIEPIVFEDTRGYFFESYNQKVFESEGLHHQWVQDNQSHSHYGVVRGLHYQLNPFAQAKLVRVVSGNIQDVAVDLRKGSPTYGKVYSIELSAENRLQLLIPKGFAHGFSVLSETADVIYKCDTLYQKSSEASIIYNDPVLQIDWKVPAHAITLSEKDLQHPGFAESKNNFEFDG